MPGVKVGDAFCVIPAMMVCAAVVLIASGSDVSIPGTIQANIVRSTLKKINSRDTGIISFFLKIN